MYYFSDYLALAHHDFSFSFHRAMTAKEASPHVAYSIIHRSRWCWEIPLRSDRCSAISTFHPVVLVRVICLISPSFLGLEVFPYRHRRNGLAARSLGFPVILSDCRLRGSDNACEDLTSKGNRNSFISKNFRGLGKNLYIFVKHRQRQLGQLQISRKVYL